MPLGKLQQVAEGLAVLLLKQVKFIPVLDLLDAPVARPWFGHFGGTRIDGVSWYVCGPIM